MDWSCQDRFVSNLDDGALEEIGVVYHHGDDLVVGSLANDTLFAPQKVIGPHAGLSDQSREVILGKRLIEIIYLVVINAVFTKQRRKIAAGGSGRFFVNSYFLCHSIISR